MERKILVLLFSFLCVFILIALILIVLFPSINPVYLAIIPLVISIFLTYVLIKMSKEPSSIEREYKIGKGVLVTVSLFLNTIAVICILGGIIWLIIEKQKDFALIGASGLIIFLGIVCLSFGIIITRSILVNYKNITAYKARKESALPPQSKATV